MAFRSRLSAYVSYRLELVSRTARRTADAVYKAECGLDIKKLRIMRIVEETPDTTVSELVEASMYERTLISRQIGELAKAGILTRNICTVDARQTRLSLTSVGLAFVAHANRIGDAMNKDFLSVLSPEERVVFDTCLDKLSNWQPSTRFMISEHRKATSKRGATDDPS
jgi:DNA-binding MarR family transcriptional regulator